MNKKYAFNVLDTMLSGKSVTENLQDLKQLEQFIKEYEEELIRNTHICPACGNYSKQCDFKYIEILKESNSFDGRKVKYYECFLECPICGNYEPVSKKL